MFPKPPAPPMPLAASGTALPTNLGASPASPVVELARLAPLALWARPIIGDISMLTGINPTSATDDSGDATELSPLGTADNAACASEAKPAASPVSGEAADAASPPRPASLSAGGLEGR